GVRFLLGVDADKTAYFGLAGPKGSLGAGPLPPPGTDMAPPEPGVRPASLRLAAPLLRDRDAGLFTPSVALAHSHAPRTPLPRRPDRPSPRGALATLPGRRQRTLSPDRPGRDHARDRRRGSLPARTQQPLAPAPGLHPGRFRRGGGVRGAGRGARGQRGDGDR